MPSGKLYYRPIVQADAVRPTGAYVLAGGPFWFDRVEVLSRAGSQGLVPAQDVPKDVLDNLTRARGAMGAVTLDQPRLMGIVNVTPDSFSDGGQYLQTQAAIDHGVQLAKEGADILDIGGESTRPGAAFVPEEEEIGRIKPVVAGLTQKGLSPISIDTRKSRVAWAALGAGAAMLNDVSAFSFDPQMSDVASKSGKPICLMHAQGDPETMQMEPRYDNVVLDVYDYLEGRIAQALAAGIDRDSIIVDPGIGFGKTMDHNLLLLRNISIFHSLGCAVLLGVSRKRFIGTIGDAPDPADRVPGSIAVALAGVAQGVQIVRVHDVAASRQALALFEAMQGG